MAFRIGSNANDIFNASAASDIFLTLGGNDQISVGGGTDIVFAGNGNDTITVGGGTNIVFGGAGADVFEFEAGATGVTMIRDFEDGTDQIDLSDLGITDVSELTITAANGGSVITIGALEIQVNVAPGSLSNADFIFAEAAPAQIIDFEGLDNASGYADTVPDGHAGFTWTNFSMLETDEYETVYTSGYTASSGDNVAINLWGDPASIASDTNFDLESVNLAAAWNEGLQVTVAGYDNGNYLGEQTFTLAYGVSQTFELDDSIFDSVDEVVFTSFGGTEVDTDDGAGTHFALDDLVIL
ncbi:MAG: hypothetical protein CML68_17085 [Rhodobacteraceae bacterium]|nr:hypothetical protein [Paracoccaceae bacterium]